MGGATSQSTPLTLLHFGVTGNRIAPFTTLIARRNSVNTRPFASVHKTSGLSHGQETVCPENFHAFLQYSQQMLGERNNICDEHNFPHH
jgi:hypothetical protein